MSTHSDARTNLSCSKIIVSKHTAIEPDDALHNAKQIVGGDQHRGVATQFNQLDTLWSQSTKANLIDAHFEVGDSVNTFSNGEDELVGSGNASVGYVGIVTR